MLARSLLLLEPLQAAGEQKENARIVVDFVFIHSQLPCRLHGSTESNLACCYMYYGCFVTFAAYSSMFSVSCASVKISSASNEA